MYISTCTYSLLLPTRKTILKRTLVHLVHKALAMPSARTCSSPEVSATSTRG
jgi:hypothetical protein